MRLNPFKPLPALLLLASPLISESALAGAACVIAKEQGNSLAISWTLNAPTVESAIEQTKQELQRQGYEYVFPQANSELSDGWLVIVKTEYTTRRNRLRTSYGCGFHTNPQMAEQQALSDLRAYSWGWKPELGYTLFRQLPIDAQQ